MPCLLALPFPAHAETVLTVATHYTQQQLAPLAACFRQYEREHPGLRIVHRQSAIEDYLQTVLTGRIGGNAPDIYNVYSVWGPQLVQSGVLDPPPAAVSEMVTRDYVPGTVDAIRVDGRAWGIPTEISTFMLVYNKLLFRAAGLAAPPATWDEVVADAARLTRRDAQGRLTTAGYAFGPTPANAAYPFLALLASRGVSLLTPDRRGTNLDTPEAAAVLAGQRALFAQGSADATVQVRDFPSGAVGMMIYANWFKDTLHDAFGAATDDTVGVAPIPGGPDWRTVQYGFFWAVDAGSAHRAEAWDLLAWLVRPRSGAPDGPRSCTGAFLARLGALTGNRVDLAASPEYQDAFSRPFAQAIRDGRAVPAPDVLRGTELLRDLRTAIASAWTGTPPGDALRRAARQVDALLRER